MVHPAKGHAQQLTVRGRGYSCLQRDGQSSGEVRKGIRGKKRKREGKESTSSLRGKGEE